MNDYMTFLIGSISIHPNATKHVSKYKIKESINSMLVEQEILERFKDKITMRINDVFQVNSLSNLKGYYLELLSTTSDGFVELGANIGDNGSCTVIHFLTH